MNTSPLKIIVLLGVLLGMSGFAKLNAQTLLITDSTAAPNPVDFEFRSDGTMIAKGNIGTGSLLSTDQGCGMRLLWYPAYGAFRAGDVTGTAWNSSNLGWFSVAFGQDTTASGLSSMAVGCSTTASGNYSTAMGFRSYASNQYSTAIGQSNATGMWATAIGDSMATNTYSTAIGNASAVGSYSTAMGLMTIASGNISTAFGQMTVANSYCSTAIGSYNIGGGNQTSWVLTDPLFEIGNGPSTGGTSDAFIVYKNGNATFQGTVNATAFAGSGAGLTNLPAGSISGALQSTVTVPAASISGALPSTVSVSATLITSGTLPSTVSLLGVLHGTGSETPTFAGETITGNVGIGTTNPQSTLDVNGNIHSAGLLVEKSLTFTPTQNYKGWYRIINSSSPSAGGIIRISAPSYDNTITDVEFQFDLAGYGCGGAIQQTRYSSYNNGCIGSVQISSDGGQTLYLDVYVQTANVPVPITIYGFGPDMPNFAAVPQQVSNPGSTDFNLLILGPGFRSTSGANFAETSGNVGIGTANPQAKLDVTGNANVSGTVTAQTVITTTPGGDIPMFSGN